MKITIDTESRVFLISRQGFFTRDFFCNLEQIPQILKDELKPNDEFKIFEYWNKKFKVCSKKHLNEMFKAMNVNFKL